VPKPHRGHAETDQGGVRGQRRTYPVQNVDMFYVKCIKYKYDADV